MWHNKTLVIFLEIQAVKQPTDNVSYALNLMLHNKRRPSICVCFLRCSAEVWQPCWYLRSGGAPEYVFCSLLENRTPGNTSCTFASELSQGSSRANQGDLQVKEQTNIKAKLEFISRTYQTWSFVKTPRSSTNQASNKGNRCTWMSDNHHGKPF